MEVVAVTKPYDQGPTILVYNVDRQVMLRGSRVVPGPSVVIQELLPVPQTKRDFHGLLQSSSPSDDIVGPIRALLTSTSYLRAAEMSRSGPGRAVLVGEYSNSVSLCSGPSSSSLTPNYVLQSTESGPSTTSSFWAEFSLASPSSSPTATSSSSSCPLRYGHITLEGTGSSCQIKSPKVVSSSTTTTPTTTTTTAVGGDFNLVLAQASQCASNSELAPYQQGLVGMAVRSTPGADQGEQLAKVLLRSESVMWTLDVLSASSISMSSTKRSPPSESRSIWVGGRAIPMSSTCKPSTPAVSAPCKFFFGQEFSANVSVLLESVWVGKAKVDIVGQVSIEDVHLVQKSATDLNMDQLVSIQFLSRSTAAGSDVGESVVLVFRKGQEIYTSQLIPSSSSSSPSSSSSTWSTPVKLVLPEKDTTPFNILHVSAIDVALPPRRNAAGSPPTPPLKVGDAFVLAYTRSKESSVERLSLTSLYEVRLPVPSQAAAQAITAPKAMLFAYLSQPTLASSMTTSVNDTQFNMPNPATRIRSTHVVLKKVDNTLSFLLGAASTSSSQDDIPVSSLFTTDVRWTPNQGYTTMQPPTAPVAPPPTLAPVAPPSTAPTSPPPPITTTNPPSQGEGELPATPLYVDKPLPPATKWAIFALAFVVLAGIAYFGFRYWQSRRIALLQQQLRHRQDAPQSLAEQVEMNEP